MPRPGSSKREEELINAYEAEEERIINVLSRKLEQVRTSEQQTLHLTDLHLAEFAALRLADFAVLS